METPSTQTDESGAFGLWQHRPEVVEVARDYLGRLARRARLRRQRELAHDEVWDLVEGLLFGT
jgi:hypothetical protein